MLADRSLGRLLRQCSVLPALKLAAHDEARGTMSRQRAAEMTRSILTIIGDLEKHVDVKPHGKLEAGAPVQRTAAGPVACVAGRRPD